MAPVMAFTSKGPADFLVRPDLRSSPPRLVWTNTTHATRASEPARRFFMSFSYWDSQQQPCSGKPGNGLRFFYHTWTTTERLHSIFLKTFPVYNGNRHRGIFA